MILCKHLLPKISRCLFKSAFCDETLIFFRFIGIDKKRWQKSMWMLEDWLNCKAWRPEALLTTGWKVRTLPSNFQWFFTPPLDPPWRRIWQVSNVFCRLNCLFQKRKINGNVIMANLPVNVISRCTYTNYEMYLLCRFMYCTCWTKLIVWVPLFGFGML